MIDANSKMARSITAAAVLTAAACHSVMSWRFGQSLGATELEKNIFSVFGGALDVCKVFALAFAAYAWEKGRKAKAAACLVVWATTVVYSGVAAMGFAALSRDTIVAGRTSDVAEYKATAAELNRLLAQMEAARANPMFAETYGCTEYAKGAARGEARKRAEFCSAYWRADLDRAALRPQIKATTATEADPQAALMARVLGTSRETMATALAIFLAVVAEIVSALGTWTFSTSRRKPERPKAAAREPRKPQLVVSN
jgi:hypothetical protein